MHRRRLERHEIAGTARFLTFSCYRRLPLFQNARIRDRFIERLTLTSDALGVPVLAWVVMPEHVHLIVLPDPPRMSVTRFVHALKRPFALEVLNRWRTLAAPILARLAHGDGHRFWQTGGGFDRNMIGGEVLEKIRYVHANPVRRGLVSRSIDYRWSSAAAYEGAACPGPPIPFDRLPPTRDPLT